MTIGRLTAILLLACVVITVPVMAGSKYIEGSPELSAYVSGTNEFSQGQDVQLTVVIQNTGRSEYKYTQTNLVDPADLPSTAKYLSATLLPGAAPLKVRSDPQQLGDLAANSRASAVFTTKIDAGAPAGTYTLPLILNYSYLDTTDQLASDTIKYTYTMENVTIALPVKIKSDVSIDVVSATADHLNAGSDGTIIVVIKNTGSEDGTGSVAKISRNGNSPITPVDSSVYIGDFPAGKTVECRYKVAVADTAERQSYPLDILVSYKNHEGDTVTSRTETLGLPVGGKVDFAIVSPPAEIHPGSRETITVEYRNTGDTAVYGAQARISAADPFSSADDVSYIGDLQPGESRNVSYTISVDRTATIKEYGLDSEIRYRDSLDTTYISDIMKVTINVTRPSGIGAITSNPIYLSIIAAAVIGLIYLAYHFRKKSR